MGRVRTFILFGYSLSILACGGESTTDAGTGIDAGGLTDAHTAGETSVPDTGTPPPDAGDVDAPVSIDLGGIDAPGCADADGDGHQAISCGGDDCDDADADAYPTHPEICDAAGHDEDCNPTTLGTDADLDTFVSAACCNHQPGGGLSCGPDCDDTRATVNPSAVEACNTVDDDCDTMIDEGVLMTLYADADGDMYGDSTMPTTMGCTVGAMQATVGGDCNDTVPTIHPGATEACNGVDDNCNGSTDESIMTTAYLPDCDYDGWATSVGTPMVGCAAPTAAPPCAGGGMHGWSSMFGDCNDANMAVHPGLTEVPCNGLDDDCDGATVDTPTMTFYRDADGDTFGDPSMPSMTMACATPLGYSANSLDCNDADGSRHPGAAEVCDGFDDNCDTMLLPGEDDDGDTFPDPTACTPVSAPRADCNDMNAAIHPGVPEITGDGIDQNCDGTETCFLDSDRDGYRPNATATVASADADCADPGEALGTVPIGDCCDVVATGADAAMVHPGAGYHTTTRSAGCGGGYDWDCSSVVDQEPLPHPAVAVTPMCSPMPACGGFGGPGWDSTQGGVPSACGAMGSWWDGSCTLRSVCAPSCITFCSIGSASTPYTRGCR